MDSIVVLVNACMVNIFILSNCKVKFNAKLLTFPYSRKHLAATIEYKLAYNSFKTILNIADVFQWASLYFAKTCSCVFLFNN
jgi:hypothetical protein